MELQEESKVREEEKYTIKHQKYQQKDKLDYLLPEWISILKKYFNKHYA